MEDARPRAARRRLASQAALQKLTRESAERLGAARAAGVKVAWCSSMGPAELLRALGFEVFFPENHAAMIGASPAARRCIDAASPLGYAQDLCAYLRADIGASLVGETPLVRYGLSAPPPPDALVFNTNQCREVQDWFAHYARRTGAPLLGIHSPQSLGEVSPEAIAYAAAQIRALVPPLERIAGRRFDEAAFSERIELSRRACALWRAALETSRARPAPFGFFDACVHMGPVVTLRGTREAVAYYETLLAELEARAAAGRGAVPAERLRLYWEGMPIWFQLGGLGRFFAERGANVVGSTYCSSWTLDALNPARPFESSAAAYLGLFIARAEDVKQAALARELAAYSADGVVFHEARTCPRNSNTRHGLPRRLAAETGIPVVEIHGDFNDPGLFAEAQVHNVLETFLEQLAARGVTPDC